MPFVQTDAFHKLDADTIELAGETYGKPFLTKEMVDIVDYSDMNRKIYLNLLSEYGKVADNSGIYTSDIAVTYLKKMQQMCDDNNIKLHILPGPMPDTDEIKSKLEEQKKEFEENGLGDLMETYYDSVILYPVEYFPDGTHPSGEYGTREKLNEMIVNLQEKSGLLEGVVLEE